MDDMGMTPGMTPGMTWDDMNDMMIVNDMIIWLRPTTSAWVINNQPYNHDDTTNSAMTQGFQGGPLN